MIYALASACSYDQGTCRPIPHEQFCAAAALAYAIWDAENTVRMHADCFVEYLERAESIVRWLAVHHYQVARFSK